MKQLKQEKEELSTSRYRMNLKKILFNVIINILLFKFEETARFWTRKYAKQDQATEEK